MPVEANRQAGQENNRDRLLIRRALRTARRNIRWQRSLEAIPASLFLPILAAAAWAAAARFTLADLPRWPEGLFFAGWLAVLIVQLVRMRVAPSEAAAFLDQKLDLDERVSTLLEFEGRTRIEGRMAEVAPFMYYLVGDTAFLLRQRLELLPHPFRLTNGRSGAILSMGAIILFAAVLVAPTSLDAVRNEQTIVKTTLEQEAQHIGDLRAQLVERPDLPSSLKDSLSAELSALEKSLMAAPTDRADALAAIADAEERVRELVPGVASSDFDPVTRAAELLKDAASSTVDVGASSIGETGDITTVADALKRIKDTESSLGAPQLRALATNLDRAAAAAASKDPELAKNLSDAADAARNKNGAALTQALDAAAAKLDAAQKAQQAAQAVESTLSQLEDGRQNIATAGAAAVTKRAQVGFKRANPTPATAEAAPAAADVGGDQTNRDSVLAQGPTGSGGAQGSSGGGGTQAGGQPQSGGGQSGGPASGAPLPSQQGSAGVGSGGGQGTGSQGGNLGRIVGPIKGSGGSSNAGGEAQGNGVTSGGGTTGSDSGNRQTDQVYVPNRGDNAPSGTVGQAAPEPQSDGISGRPGEGAGGDSSGAAPGIGSLSTIHTPYTDVIGQYAQQATEALDRAYVPPDAKSYVRDYFSALGK